MERKDEIRTHNPVWNTGALPIRRPPLKWRSRSESNRRMSDRKTDTLSTELHHNNYCLRMRRFELPRIRVLSYYVRYSSVNHVSNYHNPSLKTGALPLSYILKFGDPRQDSNLRMSARKADVLTT